MTRHWRHLHITRPVINCTFELVNLIKFGKSFFLKRKFKHKWNWNANDQHHNKMVSNTYSLRCAVRKKPCNVLGRIIFFCYIKYFDRAWHVIGAKPSDQVIWKCVFKGPACKQTSKKTSNRSSNRDKCSHKFLVQHKFKEICSKDGINQSLN